jgi:hypothetical protein
VAPESGGVGAAAILSHNDFCTPVFLHPQPLTAKPHPGITTPPATLEVGHFNPVKTMATFTQIEANRLNSQHTIGPRCPRSGQRSQPEPISKSAAWPRDWVRSVNSPPAPGPASEASPNPCQISRLAQKLGSFRQFPGPWPPGPWPRERSEPEILSNQPPGPEIGFVSSIPPGPWPLAPGPASEASPNPCQISHLAPKLGSFRQFPPAPGPRALGPASEASQKSCHRRCNNPQSAG